MNVERLLTEVEHLDENALEQLKDGIARRESELRAQRKQRTAEDWGVVLDQFLDEFWSDTTASEQDRILEAIRFKNIPPG
jgi:hypothetical protein